MICVMAMGVIEEELISITVISWIFKTNCFKQSFSKFQELLKIY